MSDPTINGGNLPQVNVIGQNRQKIRQDLLKGIEFAKRAGTDYSELQAKLNQFDAELAAELGAEKNTDTAKFTNQPATEADKEAQATRAESHQNEVNEVNKMKDKALARRQKVDPKFEEKCAELDAARADYDALLEEYNSTNAEYNKVHKKSITFSKKAKEAKDAARKAVKADREEVKAKLAEARERMLEAEKAFGSDKALKAASQYLLEQAEKDGSLKMKQRAARYQADTFFDRTEEGQKAKLDNAKLAARGDLNRETALSKAERRTLAKARKAEEEALGLPSESLPAKGKDIKRNEKNYRQIRKEQALEKIVIGDKDSYKKQKKDDKNGNPTVTYMSEKTYNAAREFAASKGVALPKYKKGLELTDQQMREYQQVMLDAACDFGDRADISERKRISDNFKDISFVTTKNMFKAANIDVQLRHNTAAAVAGTVTGIVTGGKLVEEAQKLVTKIIPGGGGVIDNIADHTQHGTTTDAVITTPEGYNKFNVGNALKHVGAGLAAAALVKLLDHEIGLLKKGKTLEDVVYNTLDQDVPAFKNCTPNAKKKMARFIANPSMTSEQKLAILEKAMGTGKLNPRELASAIAQLDKYNPKEDAPTTDDVKKDTKVLYAREKAWVDENGNPVDLAKMKLVDDFGKPIDLTGENVGASATAVSKSISEKTKGLATDSDQVKFEHNPNDKHALSQIIISNPGVVRDIKGKPKDPDEYVIPDFSNDQENLYKMKKLTPDEVKENGLDPNKTWHVLDSAEGPNKSNIAQNIGKIYEYHYTDGKQGKTIAHIVDEKTNEIVMDVELQTNNEEYRLDATEPIKRLKGKGSNVGSGSAAKYSQTGARPIRKA